MGVQLMTVSATGHTSTVLKASSSLEFGRFRNVFNYTYLHFRMLG